MEKIIDLGEGYRLRVSSDEMEAWLEGPSGAVSYEEFRRLKERLEGLGLQDLLDPPVLKEGRLIVARGQPPEDGEDGKIEFLVDFSQGPKEISSHMVGWREINALVSVPPGTAVAKVHPPLPGIPGFIVWGKPIPPKPGKRMRIKVEARKADALLERLEKELGEFEGDQGAADLILGPGLKYVVEEGLIVAQEGGFLELKGRRLLLHSVYTLKGDVDWDTGNICFHGKKIGDYRVGTQRI